MFHPLTVFSPTSGSWCYPNSCASDVLSFSSTPTALLSPALSCPHILFSSQYMTIPLQTTFMHFLDISPTFPIPEIFSFLILSSLVTKSSILTPPFPPLIVIYSLPMYIGFCPSSRTLLHTYPVLSLHTYLAVHSTYCASRFLDEALYRAPSLFRHTLPHREYCIRHPSAWHKTKLCVPKSSLNNPFQNRQSRPISALSLCNPRTPECLTPLHKLVQSDYLSTPLI